MSLQGHASAWRFVTLLGAAVVLAACGSDASDSGTGDCDESAAVCAQDHPELGQILVDSEGKTLYFADQESDGTIRCVNDCLGFWEPVAVPAGAAPSAPDVTDLDVLQRTDNGQGQLTYQGKPLYTFKDDAVGEVSGNNLEDDFGGTLFVWRAVTVEGADAPPAEQPDDPYYGGGGY